jgi:hypothetical protein
MTGQYSDPPMSKIVLENIIDGLESSREAINETQKQVNSMDKTLALVKQSQDEMNKTMEQLLKIIRDGNGKASLMDRVNCLENTQKLTENFISDQKAVKTVKTQGTWQLRIALLTGSLSLVGVLITAVAKIFFG